MPGLPMKTKWRFTSAVASTGFRLASSTEYASEVVDDGLVVCEALLGSLLCVRQLGGKLVHLGGLLLVLRARGVLREGEDAHLWGGRARRGEHLHAGQGGVRREGEDAHLWGGRARRGEHLHAGQGGVRREGEVAHPLRQLLG